MAWLTLILVLALSRIILHDFKQPSYYLFFIGIAGFFFEPVLYIVGAVATFYATFYVKKDKLEKLIDEEYAKLQPRGNAAIPSNTKTKDQPQTPPQ